MEKLWNMEKKIQSWHVVISHGILTNFVRRFCQQIFFFFANGMKLRIGIESRDYCYKVLQIQNLSRHTIMES